MMRTQHTVVKPETVTWRGSLSETPSGIRVHCCGETSRKIPTRPQAVRRLIHKSRSSRGNVATVLCFTISPTYIESYGDELIAVYLLCIRCSSYRSIFTNCATHNVVYIFVPIAVENVVLGLGLIFEKRNGMDVSVGHTVIILPPLTISRMRSQPISCPSIRDSQTKG